MGGTPPAPGGVLGRRSLLWLGRSDASVNDMLRIAQRHRGGWRTTLVLPTSTTTPEPESRAGGAPGHSLQRDSGCLSCSISGGRGSTIPTLPLIFLRELEAGWVEKVARWRAAGMAAHSRVPAIRAFHFCPRLRYPSSTRGLKLPKAPIRGTQESQLQRLPRTKTSESSIPKTQASRPSFLLLSKSSIRDLSFQGPCRLRNPSAALGPGVQVPPSTPRNAGLGLLQSRWTPGRVELTDPGQILAPGASSGSGSGSGCRERRTGRGRGREQVRRRDSGWREAGPGVEGETRLPRAPWDL